MVPSSRNTLRNGGRKCFENAISYLWAKMITKSSGGRVGGIENSAFRDDIFEWFYHPFVMRNVGIDHLQKSEGNGGASGGVNAIDEARSLRGRLGEMEFDVIIADGNL